MKKLNIDYKIHPAYQKKTGKVLKNALNKSMVKKMPMSYSKI